MAETPPPPTLSTVAGSVYAALIADQLTQARALKSSLEQRGLAVITTSGTLVSLLFAFSAVTNAIHMTTPGQTSPGLALPIPTRVLLALAMLLFIQAVVLALSINEPRQYHEVRRAGFEQLLKEPVWDSPNTARGGFRVAQLQVDLIDIFQRQNQRKAKMLNLALSSEVAAVAILGLSVGTFLLQG